MKQAAPPAASERDERARESAGDLIPFSLGPWKAKLDVNVNVIDATASRPARLAALLRASLGAMYGPGPRGAPFNCRHAARCLGLHPEYLRAMARGRDAIPPVLWKRLSNALPGRLQAIQRQRVDVLAILDAMAVSCRALVTRLEAARLETRASMPKRTGRHAVKHASPPLTGRLRAKSGQPFARASKC